MLNHYFNRTKVISAFAAGSPGKKSLLAAAVALLAAGYPHAQIKFECSLRGADTVLSTGATVKRCLDLSALDNKTVVIPANVTRIDNTGFALCESSEQSGGQADIVYAMDQSGSMGIKFVWISPDLKDTIWLEGLQGCGLNEQQDAATYGSITIPNDAGTRQIPKINPAKSIAGCTSFSGDPYTQRGVAFKQAIDFQAARAPGSTAGFMGFAQSVTTPVRPLTLNSAANINRIKAAIVPALSNNTNYRDPLDTAKKWLLTPTLAPNPSKAIIFLSDGQPTWPTNNPNGYLDVLSATYPQMPGAMPPVYGIFMGKPSADTAKLSDLSKRTGGIFFLIPPSRPDSLKAVVEKILNVILRQYQPNSALVTNSSVAPTQMGRAGAGDFARQADGHWLMSLDKPVGLKAQGDNAINLKTALIDLNSGALKSDTTDFILNTTGPDASTNANLPGTQFGVACVDLPPPINPVKAAYIKDANGDGAADIVFFVFTRPLAALPASIDSVYWNQLGPQFANKIKPALSFLIASGNTVVIADFSATQFPWPQGVTSIPTGAQPVGVLPAGGVFLSQRPLIQDSIGPILIKATIKPFDNSKVVSASDLNVDTIIVTTSEGMLTATDWNKLLVWSKSQNNVCSDYQNALPLVPKGQPDIDASSSTFIFLVPTGTGTPTPLAKDCVYLNVAGSYTDMKHNIPPIYGIPLEGKDPPRRIELFRGYPPVVGITADKPGFVVVTNDPRKGDANDYSTSNGAGSYTTTWIPPYGFSENQTFNPDIPALNAAPVGIEIAGLSVLPPGISTVQVVSNSKYIVDVNIYDNNGNFVRKLRQAFGYHGELNNSNRISLSKHGMVSYLVWDLKDESGQKAGQGAYIWKASFQFDGGKQEIQYTRTGVVRRPDWRTAK